MSKGEVRKTEWSEQERAWLSSRTHQGADKGLGVTVLLSNGQIIFLIGKRVGGGTLQLIIPAFWVLWEIQIQTSTV